MPDTDRQMDADTGEAVLSTALGERLLRRRSEPLGVIDVRQPQQHYARTAGWVAQRFALLEHWQRRYGNEADTAAAHAGLVFAVPGQPELHRTFASPTQLTRLDKQADVPQPRPDSMASSTPPEQFQIRRRSAAPAALPQTVAIPHGRRHATAPSDTATSSSSVRSASTRRSGASETLAIPQAEHGELRTADSPAPQATPMPATLMSPRLPAINVSRGETVSASLPLPLQRKASEAATGLARAQESTIPAVSWPITRLPGPQSSARQLPFAASPGYESLALAGGEGAASEITNGGAAQARPTGGVVALATVASPAASPLVQRQPVGSARATAIAPGEAIERPVARAAERRAASAGAPTPSMVWRQVTGSSSGSAFATAGTSGARSDLPLAISAARSGESQVARQATPTESTSSTSAESPAPVAATPAHATPPAHTIDIARLAEQVSELLGRRLEIERERRGMTG